MSFGGATWLQNEAQLVKVENKMDALNREKSTQLLDLGKMKQDAEVSGDYVNCFVCETCEGHSVLL